MKKLFVIVTITSFLVACNGKTEESSSSVTTKDTAVIESPLMDAINTEDSVIKKIQDSSGKMIDTIMKK
jgi:uncharacterized protein YcfL